jgi:hypothetical protein
MRPDRTNYEIWLIDYLDGNLNEEQEGQLLSFLDENPDIKNEFEGLSAVHLSHPDLSFVNKNSLKRSADSISMSQFDLLCVASIENDLSAEQKQELDEIISAGDDRKKTIELFAKTKLTPRQHTFSYKNRLKKSTAGQKVFWFSVTGLSAAATILMLFTLVRNPWVNNKVDEKDNLKTEARNSNKLNTEEFKINQSTIKPAEITEAGKASTEGNLIAKISETVTLDLKQSDENDSQADYARYLNESVTEKIEKISGSTFLPKGNLPATSSLVSMNLTTAEYPEEESENAVGNFFTRIIREKILKSETAEKGSLKAYEVADAGITGINLLFGSNMTLEKNFDEKGEVKSVYFNSKLLKFNAPVKKAEPLE